MPSGLQWKKDGEGSPSFRIRLVFYKMQTTRTAHRTGWMMWWVSLYLNAVVFLKRTKAHIGRVVERMAERNYTRRRWIAHTVSSRALLKGGVVQARLLSPCGKRHRCQVLLGGHCACPCPWAVHFWGWSTWGLYYSGSTFILNICLSFTSFSSFQGNSPMRSSRTSRKSYQVFPDYLKR
jgi:hypothetical protein